MKIAFLYAWYPPLELYDSRAKGDGGAYYVEKLSKELAAHGFEIHVVASQVEQARSNGDSIQPCEGLTIHHVVRDWGIHGLIGGQYKALRCFLTNLRPDILLLVLPAGGLGCSYFLPCFAKLMMPRTPIVTVVFTPLPRWGLASVVPFLVASTFLYLSSTKLCFESLWMMKTFGRLLPFLKGRLVFIPTGSAVTPGQPYRTTEVRHFRQRMGLRTDAPHISFLGVWTRRKNLGVLLKAAAPLRTTHPGLTLLFVGGRAREDMTWPHEKQMLQLIEELGLSKSVFFTGHVDEQTFNEYMLCSDVCVMPYDNRTAHSTLYTAMAAGLPIIAVGGQLEELFKHGESAFLIDAPDETLLAKAIQQLLDDESLRDRLSHAARRAAEATSWPSLRRQWVKVLEDARNLLPRANNLVPDRREVPPEMGEPGSRLRAPKLR